MNVGYYFFPNLLLVAVLCVAGLFLCRWLGVGYLRGSAIICIPVALITPYLGFLLYMERLVAGPLTFYMCFAETVFVFTFLWSPVHILVDKVTGKTFPHR